MPKQQDIVRLVAALQAANNVVNDVSVPDEIAFSQFKIASVLEKKLCAAVKNAMVIDGYLCEDEQRAVDGVLLDSDDPPEFADSFKAELFRLRAA